MVHCHTLKLKKKKTLWLFYLPLHINRKKKWNTKEKLLMVVMRGIIPLLGAGCTSSSMQMEVLGCSVQCWEKGVCTVHADRRARLPGAESEERCERAPSQQESKLLSYTQCASVVWKDKENANIDKRYKTRSNHMLCKRTIFEIEGRRGWNWKGGGGESTRWMITDSS